MGIFDKISSTVKQLKEENKYFAKTTKRINDKTNFYGRVYGDFKQGSYVSIENGQGVIYNVSDEDYVFNTEDIITFDYVGEGGSIKQGDVNLPTMSFCVTFKDDKKAEMDIIASKVDAFKNKFYL